MDKFFDKLLERWGTRGIDFEVKIFCCMSVCVHLGLALFTFDKSILFALYQILSAATYGIMGAKFKKKHFVLLYCAILCEIVGHAVVVWLFTGNTCYAEQYIILLIIMISYIVFFVESYTRRMIFSITVMTICVCFYFFLHSVLGKYEAPLLVAKMSEIQSQLTMFFSMSVLFFLFAWVSIQTIRNHDRVEKLQRDNSRLKSSNDMDFLTGVYSRKYAQYILDEHYRIYCETGKLFSIAIGDIDFFKTVNDEYGHEAGDVVLQKLGKIFMSSIRETDVASRWGGEEFLFIFEADLDTAIDVLERLRQKIENTLFQSRERDISVTMTFGCTQIKPGETVLELVHRVDSYLYWGKKEGRNRVVSSRSLREETGKA